jgi:hypothetical protein
VPARCNRTSPSDPGCIPSRPSANLHRELAGADVREVRTTSGHLVTERRQHV